MKICAKWLMMNVISSFNPVIPHHARVLMFEIVTMIQVHACVILEADENPHGFAGHHQDGILPAVVHEAAAETRA